mgnify:CR=1 FL=1
MEEQMLNEAKEQVVTGFEKFSSGSGVNTQVSQKNETLTVFATARMQICQRTDGQTIRPLMALDHGRGLLFRCHPPSQNHPLHVLCG